MQHVFFPILCKIVGSEFDHEGDKQQGNDTITVGTDPISDVVVKEAIDDHGNLISNWHITAGEMSPAIRIGNLEGELCSTVTIGVLLEGIL